MKGKRLLSTVLSEASGAASAGSKVHPVAGALKAPSASATAKGANASGVRVEEEYSSNDEQAGEFIEVRKDAAVEEKQGVEESNVDYSEDEDDDQALWELFDVDSSHCVSLRDICKFLYFSGLGNSFKKTTLNKVLQELQEFGQGARQGGSRDLSFTRRNFAKMCSCQEVDLVQVLGKLYEEGYRKQIGSLFDGGSLRYIAMRAGLSYVGLTNLWLEGYFFSQEVDELKAVTGSFILYGRLLKGCYAGSVLCLVMYLSLPDLHESHSGAEVVILFIITFSALMGLHVREPMWAARDWRQTYVEDCYVEQLSLYYRLGTFTHRGQNDAHTTLLKMGEKLAEKGTYTQILEIGKQWIAPMATKAALVKKELEELQRSYNPYSCKNFATFVIRMILLLIGIAISCTPATVRVLAGGPFFGNGDMASYFFVGIYTLVCVVIYSFCSLLLFRSSEGCRVCWVLVTMLMALPKRATDRVRREREAMPADMERLPLTHGANLDTFMSFRKVVLAAVRQELTMAINSAFVLLVGGIVHILPYIADEMFGLQPVESSDAVPPSNRTTVTAMGNRTLSFASDKLFLEILASNGIILLIFFIALSGPVVYYAVRCNDELFVECTAVLTRAREETFPRHSQPRISASTRSTRRWRKSHTNCPHMYVNSGSNMNVEDRHLLAQSIGTCIDKLRFPEESRGPIEALGIPMTPRIVASLGIALVSTTAAAAFRLLTGG